MHCRDLIMIGGLMLVIKPSMMYVLYWDKHGKEADRPRITTRLVRHILFYHIFL
jgi:hypothetical protein